MLETRLRWRDFFLVTSRGFGSGLSLGLMNDNIPPTPERIAKGDLERFESSRGGSEIRGYGWPIAVYFKRGMISKEQARAGDRLHSIYASQCSGVRYVQSRYEETRGGVTIHELAWQSSEDFRNAILAIRGTVEREIALDVCLHGKYAGRRKGMERLKSALDDLVTHFKQKHP